jgi:hypothetical protein
VPGIARRVEVFNRAFRLAWPHLSQPEMQEANVGQLLSEAIQRRLKVGESDPVEIAANVIAEIKKHA